MASIRYLFTHRWKHPFGSYVFFRGWAKRACCLPTLVKRNFRRINLIRRGAHISDTAEIGEGIFQGNLHLLKIDDSSWIGRVLLRARAPITIGKFVSISDGVTILTGSHDVTDPKWLPIFAPVTIEDYVWIGTGATILPGVTLGRGSVVGAGAVVSKSVEAYAIVAGNPAKPLTKKRCENFSYNPCEFLAANQAWLKG
jgi:acetyltransferase-like isoleucine patch superfamily enzyme